VSAHGRLTDTPEDAARRFRGTIPGGKVAGGHGKPIIEAASKAGATTVCQIARFSAGTVIARPFDGESAAFVCRGSCLAFKIGDCGSRIVFLFQGMFGKS